MFCGQRPLTRAHIIAEKAIRKHLPQIDDGWRRIELWTDEAGETQSLDRSVDADPMGHWVKRACADCNSVWMNDIENRVAQHVIAMARGEAVEIDEGMASALALWAVIVTMLRGTQDRAGVGVPLSDAMAIRRASRPPEGYAVFVVQGEERWDFPTRHQTATVFGVPGYLSHFWLGQSIFIVTSPAMVTTHFALTRTLRRAHHPLWVFDMPVPLTWPFDAPVGLRRLVSVTSVQSLLDYMPDS